MKNKIIAVIPARGGSKRIPRKNIYEFDGKPLIYWTINAALNSGVFDQVVVSTDDEEIASVSISCGAIVPGLRKSSFDDKAPVSNATISTLEDLDIHLNENDIIIQLLPVCPLRNDQDIKSALTFFINEKCESLISCFKYVWMNPWWALKLDENNYPTRIFPETMKNSQELSELYCPTGAIWISTYATLLSQNTFYTKNHQFFEMDWRRAVDIDTFDDLDLALMFKKNQEIK